MVAAARARLPAYALYGEAGPDAGVDPLHCESIAARSRLHDWEIRPHRHESLFQLLVVQRGRVDASVDGRDVALDGPALVTVPPLAAHGFRFAPEVEGVVFTVQDAHLRTLLAADPALLARLQQPRAWALPRRGAAAPRDAALALRDELQGRSAWRRLAIDGALLRLLVAVARQLPADPAAAGVPARALHHVQRLRALVDTEFRAQPALAVLAARLGITPTQLNRVCRQVLGRTASGVLHARLLLEAQRELAYTAMSVKEIALGLGFSDAAYFARFFQRLTGHTPSAWRALPR